MDLSEQIKWETISTRLHDAHVDIYLLHQGTLERKALRERREAYCIESGIPVPCLRPRGAWTKGLRESGQFKPWWK